MFNVSIPKISDEEMKKRYEQIKPVVTVDGKLYHLREFTFEEVTGKSYLWDVHNDLREEVKQDELTILKGKDFSCLHTYSYYGFFKPSIGEVLSQINKLVLPLVKAFEIIEHPDTAQDFHKDGLTSIVFNNGYHVSTVRLYG